MLIFRLKFIFWVTTRIGFQKHTSFLILFSAAALYFPSLL